MKKRILVTFGTRPEAVKSFPVVEALRRAGHFDVKVCVTAQHRDMLDQVLTTFSITPDYDLNVMRQDQTPLEACSRILSALPAVFDEVEPDLLIVQGDTTTTFSSAWAAFHHRIPVAHVEAGLRSNDKYQPFPEEIIRKAVSDVADINFAPTRQAKENLLSEGVPDHQIFVTGNTVVDALLWILDRPQRFQDQRLKELRPPILTVTVHRRENFGERLLEICSAVRRLVQMQKDLTVVVPVHPNPSVRELVSRELADPRILLTEPLEYMSFVHLMKRSALVLSDSGGIQEEAPTIGVPVLVMRDVTERPEALDSGWVKLVGTSSLTLVKEAIP